MLGGIDGHQVFDSLVNAVVGGDAAHVDAHESLKLGDGSSQLFAAVFVLEDAEFLFVCQVAFGHKVDTHIVTMLIQGALQGRIHIHAFSALHAVRRKHTAVFNKRAVVGGVGILSDNHPSVVVQSAIVDGKGETVHGLGTLGGSQATCSKVDLRVDDDEHAVFLHDFFLLVFSVFLFLVLVSATGYDQGCDEQQGSKELFFHDDIRSF